MCGICGVLFPNSFGRVSRDALESMNRQIQHRGPDDEGYFVSNNLGLAMRRLSIIDVESGHQPLANENEDIWIVFNGEIYNHTDLRKDLEAKGHRYRTHSDTETIVHAYEEYGTACVQRLRGMFAFAIWDRRQHRLFAARDRLGIKPLYYRWDGTSFLFGSEIKAILAHPGVSAEFNRRVLAEYLAFGYITSQATMFAGISKLMPGHTLQITEQGDLKLERYWDLTTYDVRETHPQEYYVQAYRDMLEAAVQSHLMSDVPLGMFLSGGLDSSAVAALATKIRGDQIKTFAVGYGFDGNGEESFSELAYAREVARHIGSEHHEILLGREEFFQNLPRLIWHEDEPIAWPSSVALFSVAQLAREHVKVVLTGEGSDETLAGYTRYAWTLLNARMDASYRAVTTEAMRDMLRKMLLTLGFSASWRRKIEHTFLIRDGNSWPSFYYDNFFSAFSEVEQAELLTPEAREEGGATYANAIAAWERSRGNLLHRLLYADINSYLVELLMKQDQMSMAVSIESRVPFLDHELVNFALSIPTQYSVRGLTGKFILKEAIADLLPQAIIYRKKLGFPTPWEYWLAGPTLDRVERALLAPQALDRKLFRAEPLRRIFTEHRHRKRDHADRIWRLLNFEIWQRVFLDGESPANVRLGA
jgi:asparagine synthase (glutamine-hydrolysing)